MIFREDDIQSEVEKAVSDNTFKNISIEIAQNKADFLNNLGKDKGINVVFKNTYEEDEKSAL